MGTPTKRKNEDDETQTEVAHGSAFPTDDGSDKETDKTVLLAAEDSTKRYKSLKVRTVSTIVLIASFLGFLCWGHVPCMLLFLALQVAVVRELFTLARAAQQEDRKLPGFRVQQWYFFWVSIFFLYLRFIKTNLLVEISSTRAAAKIFSWVLRRHTLLSYLLYMAGFVSFVLSLKKGMYMYQFSQYAWTHCIIVTVVLPSSYFVANLFEGIIWWMLPAFLVVANDIFAYLTGFFLGRTPLIKLSPKKTWEGFLGGFACTLALSFHMAGVLGRIKWLTCPRRDLSFGPLDCQPDDIYIERTYTWGDVAEIAPDPLVESAAMLLQRLPAEVKQGLDTLSFSAMPIQIHALSFAVFASVIAPFGGFFASGFKRAMKVKDFGNTIPGHGGITDRFDCQVLMAMFAYVYYWTYIAKESSKWTVGEVLGVLSQLNDAQQLEVFAKLGNLLVGEGLLPERVMDTVQGALPQPR